MAYFDTILKYRVMEFTYSGPHAAQVHNAWGATTYMWHQLLAQNGYRPVVASAAHGFNFPTRPQLFTIKYVGGWAKVARKFFDPRPGIMARFQGSNGG